MQMKVRHHIVPQSHSQPAPTLPLVPTGAATAYPVWVLSQRQLAELESVIASLQMAPLGYLEQTEHASVLSHARYADGMPCALPIALDVTAEFARQCAPGKTIALTQPDGTPAALLAVSSVYPAAVCALATLHTGRSDADAAPNVLFRTQHNETLLGGKLTHFSAPRHFEFPELRCPAERAMPRHAARCAWVSKRFPDAAQLSALQRALPKEQGLLVLTWLSQPQDPLEHARIRAMQRGLAARFAARAEDVLLPQAAPIGERELLWCALAARRLGCRTLLWAAQESAPLSVSVVPVAEMGRACGIDVMVLGAAGAGADGGPEQAACSDRVRRASARGGATIFLTGLSGAGKSTLARALCARLADAGRRSPLLDGDIVRRDLSSELGFSRAHRDLNIRRIAAVAAQITRHGGIAVCAPIAPFRAARRAARAHVNEYGLFIEVYVATPLQVCEQRDVKGLYARARAGLLAEFTGISAPYETPQEAELSIDTRSTDVEAATDLIMKALRRHGLTE